MLGKLLSLFQLLRYHVNGNQLSRRPVVFLALPFVVVAASDVERSIYISILVYFGTTYSLRHRKHTYMLKHLTFCETVKHFFKERWPNISYIVQRRLGLED